MSNPETEHPNVERLDFTKSPPGYSIHEFRRNFVTTTFGWTAEKIGSEVSVLDALARVPRDQRLPDWDTALAAAWAHYKARHDPPGMQTFVSAAESWWRVAFPGHYHAGTSHPTQAEARAAAWAWYERRLALANDFEHDPSRADTRSILRRRAIITTADAGDDRVSNWGDTFWPVILTWSDDQVAEVERWLADPTAEMPEVLRA